MSNMTIGLIGIGIMLVLMFARQWVAITMFAVGLVGVMVINGISSGLSLAGTLPYSQAANYTLACIPTFVFMGCMISVSGIGADLYDAASKWQHCPRKWRQKSRRQQPLPWPIHREFYSATCWLHHRDLHQYRIRISYTP